MKIKIIMYSKLKDYFDESFVLEIKNLDTIEKVMLKLIQINNTSQDLLKICTFAIADEFVHKDYVLKENDELHIFPPVSGG